MKPEIARVFAQNFEVYGVRKVWRQMRREGSAVTRCKVERLMQHLSLQGVLCGKPIRTAVQDKAAPCPLDQVNRVFHVLAPNRLWLSDFTYVSTWWVLSTWLTSSTPTPVVSSVGVSREQPKPALVLGALEQALNGRRPTSRAGLVHHSDSGSKYVSIRDTERLAETGIEPSVGSVSDNYDNALGARPSTVFPKVKVIHRRGLLAEL